MNLIIYDLILLFLFVILASTFLYIKRKNLEKEGWLYLYRTKWGIKLIDSIGKKYKRSLKALSFISIGTGYVLMVSILYMIFYTIYLYLTTPISKVVRAPPIMPLIPYFPKLFGMESFFPPFYFIYFILAILVVLTVHEFAHGIFARRYDIGIKSTGFVFLKYFPAIFGAFVEQDENQMKKSSKFSQMSVLSAGVFANILTAIFFFILLVLFFSLTFAPSGVVFNSYAYSGVEISAIGIINGIALDNPTYKQILELSSNKTFNEITANGENFVVTKEFLELQGGDEEYLILYDDAPAIRANLPGIISEINGEKITNIGKLSEKLSEYSAGDKIIISTISEDGVEKYEVELKVHPENPEAVWLGIGFSDNSKKGIMGKIYSVFSYKEKFVYYEPIYGDVCVFIKDLIWWIFLINILVGLMNMLPVGILDGGRFFYLTIWKVTKSEKIAQKTFAGITYMIIALMIILMVKWFLGFF
jgi:membrane-associated protease RseP (regulator of RpoE activity)